MLHSLKKPIVLRVAFVLLVVATVSAVTVVPGLRPVDMMARHMGEELELIPDQLVAMQLQQIAQLDQSGTAVLVQALGNQRAIVADLAGSALHTQLDQWARMPARESSPRVAELARLLAAGVSRWDAATRGVAADLATRILRWPISSRTTDKVELIAHCEQVLQAAPAITRVQQEVVRPAEHRSGLAVTASHAVSTTSDPSGILQLPLTGTPGGELPIEEVQLPPLPPSLANPPVPRRAAAGDEPRLIPPSGRQLPRVMFPDERPRKEPSSVLPSSPVPRQLAPSIEDDPRLTELAPASTIIRDQELDQLSDLDLIHRLSGTPPVELSAVEQQLRRRGFDDPQLNLARRVADPDPLVRRRLAESLADMRTSPGQWLFWLSYDPAPMVRRLVVSLMATSQDPRLHRRLREMQRLETDESVRAQLEKLPER